MKYHIRHQTAYRYSEPASLSQNEILLYPRETATQRVMDSRVAVIPEPQYIKRRNDYFGNTVQVFMVHQPHNELTVTAQSRVEICAAAIPKLADTPAWETVAARLAAHANPAEMGAFQFVFASPLITVNSKALEYARPSFPPGRPVLSGAMDLIHRIFTEFKYDKQSTTVDTSVTQVMTLRKGVCQDFAHVAISCLRAMGLAARYVSGYLKTRPPPGKPGLVGADASHAWLSLFVPETGWVDLDPTNNLIPAEAHITLAWGRDYGDVTPVKGVVMGGGVHTLSVMVDVLEDP